MTRPSLRMPSATEEGSGLARLWIGILAPPSIWAARLATSYALVPYACWWGWLPVLHLVTVVSLLTAGLVGVMAWRVWRSVGNGSEFEVGGWRTRTRFMAMVGMLSSAFFLMVIGAEGLANVFIDPCQTAGAPLA